MEKASSDKIISGDKRLVLAGSVCSHPDIYDIIENAGGVVVWDDLCTGSRYFEGVLDEKAPPLEAIAQRYLDRPICPAKHEGLTDRAKTSFGLSEKARRTESCLFCLNSAILTPSIIPT